MSGTIHVGSYIFFLYNIYGIPCSKCSSCVKFICDLCKVPNWCLVTIGIMNQVDQNINKDMFDSDLIDVESLDYSYYQTWWVALVYIYVREWVCWWVAVVYGVMHVLSGRHVSVSIDVVRFWLVPINRRVIYFQSNHSDQYFCIATLHIHWNCLSLYFC